MSKTVDDLIMVFEKARAEAAPFPQHHEDGLYAGIAAVIRALRDEFGRIMYPGDDWNRQGILEQFDQILGDAGNEKVAGACADGTVVQRQRYGENDRQSKDGAEVSPRHPDPATDPAPAVCEITAERDRLKAALEKIADGDVPREAVTVWRSDGIHSKHDKCEHMRVMYDDCGNCICDFARKALGGDA